VAPAPAPVEVRPAGVGNLVLTKDAMGIDPRAAGDPLARATFAGAFAIQDDLGYAFQYCSGSALTQAPPSLRLSLTISGVSAGKKVHFSAGDDDLVPDGMPSLPGCYLVRGALALAEVGRGSYELGLVLSDKETQRTWDLRKKFTVE
jgi:hypothetical protein